ncbi:MAG: 1-(5-phosphoribosyl)-5-amino-4-imidazole-carboxylate carboxylase [Gemmatimonadetes bacterium]|nr:1-(5-phosphoribosyl)-5-amino-4-imidazole-carboxylate carboxylase [Gemmatimonadota bacterium]
MRRERVRELLTRVAEGSLPVDGAIDSLSADPVESLGFATIDHHRALRQGFPEVIYGAGKTVDQVLAIARRIAERGDGVLITRVEPDAVLPLSDAFSDMEYNPIGRTALLRASTPAEKSKDTVLIVTAGTSDLPVAEEAAVTADAMACRLERLNDVGVAGIHRLLARREVLDSAGVIIVVAGMDGALASVVGGLARVPVIAVPTSVGYGASFNGLAPLLTMLNSCAAGVTVVNIDNGFGAAVAAARILHR